MNSRPVTRLRPLRPAIQLAEGEHSDQETRIRDHGNRSRLTETVGPSHEDLTHRAEASHAGYLQNPRAIERMREHAPADSVRPASGGRSRVLERYPNAQASADFSAGVHASGNGANGRAGPHWF